MFWSNEEDQEATPKTSIVDFVFQMKGSSLPSNYLGAISLALQGAIPWWNDFQQISFYVNIAGEEGNGWFRDESNNGIIHISRRTLIVFRVDEEHAHLLQSLDGFRLDIDDHSITLKFKHLKAIKPAPTLYSRYMICGEKTESEFLTEINQLLAEKNIHCKKLLCGKRRNFILKNSQITTCSLMMEDLQKEDSIVIQLFGLSEFQKIGCGVFIPHKSVSVI